MPPRNKRKRAVKAEPPDSDSDPETQGEPKRVKVEGGEGGVKSELQGVKVEELSADDFVIELRNWEMSDIVSSGDDTERWPVRRSAGGRPPRRGVDVGRLYEEAGLSQLARSLGQVVKEEGVLEATSTVKEEEVEGEQRSPLRVSDFVRRAAALRAEQLLQGTEGNEIGTVSEAHSFRASATTGLRREEGRSKYGNRLTEEQRLALLDQFATNPYPNRQTKEELSRRLEVGYKSVDNWFQCERQRRGIKGGDADIRRGRCQFGPGTYDELVAQFEADPNPNLATRRFLAEKVDATVLQVSNWFRNRRRNERRKSSKVEITPKIRSELTTAFDTNPYPDRATKEALAAKVGCSVQQVAKWFNHRRRNVGLRESSEEYSRRICQFGPEGYDKLTAQFEADPHPDRPARAALAGQVGGTLQQITAWFTNRREREGIRSIGNSARQKCVFGPDVYDKLIAAFEVDPFPDCATRQALATLAGGTTRQITDWFKWRRRSQGIRVEGSYARMQCVFGPKMYDQLVAHFEADPYPDLATKRALAERAGATVKRISIWFANRRRRQGMGHSS